MGSRKGVPNKITGELRKEIYELLTDRFSDVGDILDKLKAEKKYDLYLKTYTTLLRFAIPHAVDKEETITTVRIIRDNN